MIKKYIRKQIKPIEAIELTESNRDDVLEWMSGMGKKGPGGSIFLKTPESGEGTQIAHTGKFIVKTYSEELGWHFYPVASDYFRENYEEYPKLLTR